MWTYEQRTGRLYDAQGTVFATGYSGFGPGKNAPAWQDHRDVGPIPAGDYLIDAPQCVLQAGEHGPYVLPLVPDADNQMYGRSGFLIHGDGLGDHAGHASHGCIIISPRGLREAIWQSRDRLLRVVADVAATV